MTTFKAKPANWTALPVLCVIILLAAPENGLGGDLIFGYKYGGSFALSEKQYSIYSWSGWPSGKSFSTSDFKQCWEGYVEYFPRQGHFGFSLGVSKQCYMEIRNREIDGIRSEDCRYEADFVYFIAGTDFRFFKRRDVRFNPYLNVDLLSLFYLDLFGSGPPDYPATFGLRLGGGMKLKLVERIYLNTDLQFYPGDSFASARAGLEIVF
jgi:hypothetical protein